ncbi:DNA topoisomerase IB [Sinorhizobium medicae]|uniref:DNA topoisomerase n=1 Tax=Sinorhizobium medicae TaxID=110321 RepID=A0A508X313_9HYPH|nr:DNA topoisomerase IB [Sinorhizobium medicae]MDX0520435.1 DNA topoisomerase IB [Sinorhizobium medicae]MDX0544921.1 DNA topoisomerase IB [Sinorhizobium medicae]MDX0631103.1 DNA topoisomerase IB [Sinorhizobium medicae]MDX0767334.1 DNA topoisomerase IB [Sinorhizobium medicae]MDX0902074.1 DNA topoisomerase IB [Sinorhizobium medicae]
MARAMSVDVLECRPAGLADLPQRFAAIGSVSEETGLVYVSDSEPGIRRQRRGKGFAYRMPDGSIVTDPSIKSRIAALGLPPAYENVWICLDERGHLQATGYDARGRKQYRYHSEWQALRSADKFAQLTEFGKALPKIRRTIRRHMQGGVENMQTVLAALVALLDEAHLRTGNQAYVQANGSYGATTLLKRHLRLGDGFIELKFTGKGGKRVQRVLRRPKLQRLLEEIADLPGRQLFVWKDENDALRPVDSGRLNRYLTDMAGTAISAKTFRTWGGTLAAFTVARTSIERGEWPTIKQMSEAAASVLHNTPAISRSSYIHPDVLALADKSAPVSARQLQARGRSGSELRVEEQRLLGFLQRSARRKKRLPARVTESRPESVVF